MQPRPFEVHATEADLKDLKMRLAADLKRLQETADSTESLVDSFEDGTNSQWLTKTLAPYWIKDYDWSRAEAAINAMGNHFKMDINGLDVHYVHAKPDHSVTFLICRNFK